MVEPSGSGLIVRAFLLTKIIIMNRMFRIKVFRYVYQKADTPKQAVKRATKKGAIRHVERVEKTINY